MATPGPAKTSRFRPCGRSCTQYIAIMQSRSCRRHRLRLPSGRANAADLNITLKPLAERKVSVDQVINRLRPKLARVPGATLFLQAAQDVQIGGRAGNAQFQYTLARRQPARTCSPGRPWCSRN